MGLEVIRGDSRNRTAADGLARVLSPHLENGTIYLGYPVLATADERVEVDALLVTREHGLVAFLFSENLPQSQEDWEREINTQDRLFAVLESHLGRHESLRRGRRLALAPQTVTVFATQPGTVPAAGSDGAYAAMEDVPAWVTSLEPIDPEIEQAVHAAIQRVTTIKPAKKRAAVENPSSRGAVLKVMESAMANLDRWQKAAAIGHPCPLMGTRDQWPPARRKVHIPC